MNALNPMSPPPAGKAPPRLAYTFICADCEVLHVSDEAVLPDGWTVKTISNEATAHCGECSADHGRGSLQ